ncbi:MAG: hypothetical protein EXX96DRAFT_549728 [Benjaminiella poitrasii]|nr:MAG: hypothetical protein EXX96DRAFT_549728 [Benjaminiella poitrasii]
MYSIDIDVCFIDALMLTLCELSSARIAIPFECQNVIENTRKEKKENRIKHCVQKLSTLPQTWTSYSGYFRDVVIMCFAIRYPMEKDILERLHANITLNQAKNFDLLQKQQEYLMRWRQEEVTTLHHLKHSQQELINQMDDVRDTHLRTVNQIQAIFDALVHLQNQTEIMMQRYNQMVEYHIQEVSVQLNQLALRQEVEVDHFMGSISNGLRKLDEQLNKMLTTQQDVIDHWEQTKSFQDTYLNVWQEAVEQINTSLNQVLNQTLDYAKDLQDDLSVIQDKISVITFPFKWLTELSSDVFSALQQAIIDSLIYFIHFNYIYTNVLKDYSQYHFITKVGVSLLSVSLQFYFFRFLKELHPSVFDTMYFKTFVLFLEFVIKNYASHLRSIGHRRHLYSTERANCKSTEANRRKNIAEDKITAVVPTAFSTRMRSSKVMFDEGTNSLSDETLLSRKNRSRAYYFQRYHYKPHDNGISDESNDESNNETEVLDQEEEEATTLSSDAVPETEKVELAYFSDNKKDYPRYHFHRYYYKF